MVDIDQIIAGVEAGDRSALARALTLVESRSPRHQEPRRRLLAWAAARGLDGHRVGITGPPGAGKSTLIEVLGLAAIEAGRRVAVLAIDPSSVLRGGSILGDKTRMERLSLRPEAFLRPTASDGALGGVHARTREAVLVCEAAGYDLILVETVGVGQSEVEVASMVDTFVLLAQPGAGDEVQGIKRGILELADLLVVTKADGDQAALAQRTATQLRSAMSLLRQAHPSWPVPVLQTSSVTGLGIALLLAVVADHRATTSADGALLRQRARQQRQWFNALLHAGVWEVVAADPGVRAAAAAAELSLDAGALASLAASDVLDVVRARLRG
jgi:LAO/AO transport system kinase